MNRDELRVWLQSYANMTMKALHGAGFAPNQTIDRIIEDTINAFLDRHTRFRVVRHYAAGNKRVVARQLTSEAAVERSKMQSTDDWVEVIEPEEYNRPYAREK